MASGTRRGGKKRYNSQPMEGSNKDARQDGDDGPSWSTIVNGKKTTPTPTPTPVSNTFYLLSQPNSYPDETMRGGSISSRGSARGAPRGAPRGATFRSLSQQRYQQPPPQDRPSDLGENTRFFTPVQNGPLRDEIVVECRTLNDRPFRGSITFKEATEFMFTEVMGFQFADLYSVRMRFSGCPTVRFKLKDQTNIDDLRSVEHFNLERRAQNSNEIDYIACKILGIRGMTSVPHYDGSENDIRWVKIEGAEYQLTEEQIRGGLEPFGELLTPIREDIHDDSDSEREVLIGNGTYSVKMKLQRPIPQYLPMCSRRIRIYHNGITKLCSNCYGNHSRRQCRNQKRQWIEYVRDFMYEHDNLKEDYYGKWWEIVDNEYPGYFDDNPEPSNPAQPTAAVHTQERRQRSVTRFADSRVETPQRSRDPRINRTNNTRPTTQTSNMNQQPPNTQPDRQHEMTRLLESGLTLTDAKKYLANQEEQREIERRMSSGYSQTLNPQQGQSLGRGNFHNNQ